MFGDLMVNINTESESLFGDKSFIKQKKKTRTSTSYDKIVKLRS